MFFLIFYIDSFFFSSGFSLGTIKLENIEVFLLLKTSLDSFFSLPVLVLILPNNEWVDLFSTDWLNNPPPELKNNEIIGFASFSFSISFSFSFLALFSSFGFSFKPKSCMISLGFASSFFISILSLVFYLLELLSTLFSLFRLWELLVSPRDILVPKKLFALGNVLGCLTFSFCDKFKFFLLLFIFLILGL